MQIRAPSFLILDVFFFLKIEVIICGLGSKARSSPVILTPYQKVQDHVFGLGSRQGQTIFFQDKKTLRSGPISNPGLESPCGAFFGFCCLSQETTRDSQFHHSFKSLSSSGKPQFIHPFNHQFIFLQSSLLDRDRTITGKFFLSFLLSLSFSVRN
ncbi:hypothetical protein Droror1_Dr00017317 [Drosera rotundifolia]